MYGAGMGMGGGMYGAMYGGGMGMNGMGGVGMNAMGMMGMDPNDPNAAPGPPPTAWQRILHSISGVVSFAGKIAWLVDENSQALHFFMTAMLQLLDRAGVLYGELARSSIHTTLKAALTRSVSPLTTSNQADIHLS